MVMVYSKCYIFYYYVYSLHQSMFTSSKRCSSCEIFCCYAQCSHRTATLYTMRRGYFKVMRWKCNGNSIFLFSGSVSVQLVLISHFAELLVFVFSFFNIRHPQCYSPPILMLHLIDL